MQTLEESLGLVQNDTPKRLTNQQLTDQLIEILFTGHSTFSQAATQLGIKRNRAYRLWNRWKDTEEAKQIDLHWWALYLRLKDENPEKALECLTRLKYRMTTEKHELKAELKEIKLEWKLDSNPANPVHTPPEATGVP
jgi:hypothetical protein